MQLESKRKALRVAVVEDVRESRESLAFLISEASDMICVAAVASAEDALAQLPIAKPEIVLLDIELAGDMNGVDCIQHLRAVLPSTRIVMLTVSHEPPTIVGCMIRGAVGYLHKSLPP